MPAGWSTTPPQESGSWLDSILYSLGQGGIGVAKGAGSTAFGLGSLVNSASKAFQSPLYPQTGIGDMIQPGAFDQKPPELVPQGTAQKVGFAGEQMAEFLLPGGAATKAGKGLGLAKNAGLQALAAGGVGAAQSGGDPTETAIAAGAGAAGAPLGVAGEWLAQKVPPRIINSLIKPISKEFRFGRNPGSGVVDEGIMAPTIGKLQEKVSAKLQTVGETIGTMLDTEAANKKLIDLAPMLAPLDAAATKATRMGETALAERLTALKEAPMFSEKPLVTPKEAAEVKKLLGESTRWTGQAFDADLNKAKVAVYRLINDAIDQAVPGVKVQNARYANLLSALKSVERQTDIMQRANVMNLMSGITGLGTFGATGDPEKGLAVGLGTKALGSTAGKTVGAQAIRGLTLSPQIVNLLRSLGLGQMSATRQPQS